MNLKKYRDKLNISQRQLAIQLNISPTALNKYEKELNEPSIETLIKLADIFNISIDELVERKNTNFLNTNLLSEEEQSIINIIQKLNKDFLLKVEAYAYACLERQSEENEIIKKIKGEKTNV